MTSIIRTIVVVVLAMSLIACGNSKNSSNTGTAETTAAEKTLAATENSEESAGDFAGLDYTDTGTASMYIENQSGTSENGNVITILGVSNTIMMQIGYDATDFDGTKLTYIYVDGKLSDSEQIGEETQGSIDLTGDNLKAGTHTVQFIQYDGEGETGNVIECHSAQYEVK